MITRYHQSKLGTQGTATSTTWCRKPRRNVLGSLWYIQKRTNTSLIYVVYFANMHYNFIYIILQLFVLYLYIISDLFIIFSEILDVFFLRGDHQIFTSWTSNFNFDAEARTTCISTSWTVELRVFHGENAGGPLGWYPSRLRSPLKGDIYPINTHYNIRLYERLIIKSTIPRVSPFSNIIPVSIW